MMATDAAQPLPYLTARLPGLGGTIKASPEDFEVEELPLYEPVGEGEHLYLWVEKRDMSADALLGHVARRLDIARGDIGCAGLKDSRAVTRQYLSVPARAAARLDAVDDPPRVRVLRHARHLNKLRTGHLRGNRFDVVLRDVEIGALAQAPAIATTIMRQGLPNFYGPQRFGHDGDTVALGLALLRGDQAALGRLPRARQGFMRRLGLSAVQAALFNAALAARLRENLLHKVLPGEVLQVCASGGLFVTDDVAREQARMKAREVVPAGPMFGPKMKPSGAQVQAREAAVLDAAGIAAQEFDRQGKLTQGTRRANLVWLDDLAISLGERSLRLRFSLPAGSYATTLLREFTKAPEPPAPHIAAAEATEAGQLSALS